MIRFDYEYNQLISESETQKEQALGLLNIFNRETDDELLDKIQSIKNWLDGKRSEWAKESDLSLDDDGKTCHVKADWFEIKVQGSEAIRTCHPTRARATCKHLSTYAAPETSPHARTADSTRRESQQPNPSKPPRAIGRQT